MKIFLIRHGKSDKSLQDKLPHDEFELKRTLVEGEEEKAHQLGETLKRQLDSVTGYDFVFSGKERSKQTVLAIASGLGFSKDEATANLREDFGLTYLTTQQYWHHCEESVKNGNSSSHADYFLQNPPDDPKTFSAQYMRENMRSVIKRAIERNTSLGKDVSIMVSHEPVISLCLSDFTGKSVTELGGSCNELEYAEFAVITSQKLNLIYREINYQLTI
jgi:broad specificity phosphatase PhoE